MGKSPGGINCMGPNNLMQLLCTAPLKSNRSDARHLPPRLSALILALLLGVTVCSPVQSEIYDQDQVKAVFLYNLTNFITWPPRADQHNAAAFTIGVFGHDALGTFLEHAVSGETAKGLPIAVKYFQSLDRLQSDPCDLLFIDGDQMHLWPQIREVARRHKILTVSDGESFGRRGGIVSLLTSGRKIRIEINLEEGRRNGFEISAKLLKLARIVTIGKDD